MTLVRGRVRLTLAYRPPYAWEELLRFLAARATSGVECVTGSAYLRTVAIGKRSGWLRVRPRSGRNALTVELDTSLTPVLPAVVARLRHCFDLDARPDEIAAHLRSDARLARFLKTCPGLRVPRAFDGFELAVRAIVGQLISVKAATTVAGRLAKTFGERIATPFPSLNRLAPSAERLANVHVQELRGVGIPAGRAAAIQAIARAVIRGKVDLFPGSDPESAVRALIKFPGIGNWTAQYIALRALGWPDAFPAGDLGLLRASGEISIRTLEKAAEAWRPWRAYAAIYLWQSLGTAWVLEDGPCQGLPATRTLTRRRRLPAKEPAALRRGRRTW